MLPSFVLEREAEFFQQVLKGEGEVAQRMGFDQYIGKDSAIKLENVEVNQI